MLRKESVSQAPEIEAGKTRSTHHHQSNKVLQFRQKKHKVLCGTKECGYNSNQRWQIDKKKKKKKIICERLEEIQSFPDPFRGSGRASERANVVAGMAPCYPICAWYLPTLPFEVSSPISRS
jgi:hypothetical protein